MASLALGIAGAAIGGFFGGPVGASIGWSLGAAIGGFLFAPDGPTIEGPRLADLTAPGGAEGTGIPIIRGTVRVPGKVIWSTSIIETRTEEEVEGGKGAPSGGTMVTYTYSISFAVSLTDASPNGITGVRRIWMDSKLVFSIADGATPATFAANDSRGTIRFYLGTESQIPDPLIAAAVGDANAPSFRGISYIVFDNWQLADFANHRPTVEAEVVHAGTPTHPVHTHSQASYDWQWLTIDTARSKVILSEHNPTALEWIWRWSGGSDAPVRLAQWPETPPGEIINFEYDEGSDMIIAFDDPGDTGLRIYRFDAATGAYLGQGTDNTSGISTTGGNDPLAWNNELHYDKINSCYWGCPGGFNSGQQYLSRVNIQGTGVSANLFVKSAVNLGITFGGSPGVNKQPIVDGNGRVWIVSQDHLVKCSGTPMVFAIPASTQKTFAFMWKARGEIWIPRTSGGATFGFVVFNIATETFSNSVDLGLGAWTQNFIIGIENSVGRVWVIKQASNLNGELHETNGTLVDSFTNLSPALVGMRYLPGVLVLRATNATSIFENSLAQAGENLSSLVTYISQLAGAGAVTSGSLSSDTVRGFEMPNPMPARGALEPLMGAFSFDATEHDGVLTYVKRGGAAVATLTDEDLSAVQGTGGEGNVPPPSVTISRSLETELPATLYLAFSNVDLDFNVGVARVRRLASKARNTARVDFPIAFTSAEANAVADRLMRYSWLEREKFSFAAKPRWRILEPTDVVNLPDGQRVRIIKVDYKSNGVVQCEAVSDDLGAIVSYVVGNATEVGTGVTIDAAGPSTGFVLDIPLLSDADVDEGLYVGAAGESSLWNGALIYYSRDNGVSWQGIVPTVSPLKLGAVTSGAMMPGPFGANWDHGSELTVRLAHPGLTLSSAASLDTFYNGFNTFAIGTDGETWELIQAYTVTGNADGTYTLKDFLRARKGTEHMVQAWTIGARIVGLEVGPLKRVSFPLAALGTETLWKAVTFGFSLLNAATDKEVFDAISSKPYSLVEVAGAKQASNDFQIRWTRRARKDAEWRNGANVPLDEPTEEYSIDIYDEDFVALKRTVQVLTATTLTYTSAQATTDFGAVPTAIGVRAYQISSRLGRGFVGQSIVGRETGTDVARFSATLTNIGMTLSANRFTVKKNQVFFYDWAPNDRSYKAGRWYWEVKIDTAITVRCAIGISNRYPFTRDVWASNDSFLATSDGSIIFGTGGFTYTNGDVVQVAWDATNGRVYWGKNGTWQNGADPSLGTSPQATYTPSVSWWPVVVGDNGGGGTFTVTGRFATGHSHAIPTGFVPFN